MAATVQDTMLQYSQLNADGPNEVRRQINEPINNPDTETTKYLWYIIVGTLAFLAVVGLIAVTILSSLGKSADVVAPFVTLAIGGLVGIVAPSPTQSGA